MDENFFFYAPGNFESFAAMMLLTLSDNELTVKFFSDNELVYFREAIPFKRMLRRIFFCIIVIISAFIAKEQKTLMERLFSYETFLYCPWVVTDFVLN